MLLEAGLEGMVEDYLYILDNANVFNPFESNTNDEVYQMGKRLSGTVLDIVITATGAGAAKLVDVLSQTKTGQKVIKAINNIDEVTDIGAFGKRTVGAAERYIPSNIKKVKDNYLKRNGIDAHKLKTEVLGNKGISKYDLYVDKDSGMLWIYRKGGVGDPIPTYEYIK